MKTSKALPIASAVFACLFTFVIMSAAIALPNAEAADRGEAWDVAFKNFPTEITGRSIKSAAETDAAGRYMVAAMGNLNGGQFQRHIVAVYTNGSEVVVKVFELRLGGFIPVYEMSQEKMGGLFPKVQLVDVDRDRRPEVVISLISADAHLESWVYSWNGTKKSLRLMSPSVRRADGSLRTLLRDAIFTDLTGDASLEIVNGAQADAKDMKYYEIFRFNPQTQSYARFKTLRRTDNVSDRKTTAWDPRTGSMINAWEWWEK